MKSTCASLTLGLVATLGLIIFATASADDKKALAAPLSVTFGDAGLQAIDYPGNHFLANGVPALDVVDFRNSDGTTRKVSSPAPASSSFDATKYQTTQEYDWGTLRCSYATKGNRLDFLVEVTNKSATETITDLSLQLATLALPDTSANGDQSVNNLGNYGATFLYGDNCSLALGNWEVKHPVTASLGRASAPGVYPLILYVPPEKHPHHPIVDDSFFVVPGRPIAPGQTDTYHLSLNFGAPGVPLTDLCPEVLANVREQRPLQIDWPDRRPVGALFLANPNLHWKTNPRGYRFGKGEKEDVTTPEGRAEFGAALLKMADQVIASIKSIDGQGIVVWDIEGQELWQPISYMGDPRLLPKISPEMDQFADPFFKKFTDAGLRTGICIRPTEIFHSDVYPTWNQREVKDPVETVSAKIDYAQKRWGCTLFYFDSTVFGKDGFMTRAQDAEMKDVPWVMPASMLEALHQRHPDVAIFPEESSHASYAYSMPYCSPNLRQLGTPTSVRTVYPNAASFVYTENQIVLDNWDVYVDNVVHGDIISFFDYSGTPAAGIIKLLYEEAGYRKKGPPDSVRKADLNQRIKLTRDSDSRTRYFAAESLAGDKALPAYLALADLLEDKDAIVQRKALVAIAQVPAPADAPVDDLAHRYLGIMRDSSQRVLAPFAADALGALGSAAVSPALDFLQQKGFEQQTYGFRIVSKMPSADSKIVDALTLQTKAENASMRERAATALGQIQATQAVPTLINLLGDQSEDVSVAAVVALGKLPPDRVQSAIEPLVKLFSRRYSTVVVYWYQPRIDEALRHITGEKLPRDANWWRKWLGDHPVARP